ncbi:RNA-directed DNA polymerase, eukaryota [Tanacetum coccineum]
MFGAVVYYTWQERNNRVFREEKRDEKTLIQTIKEIVQLKIAGFVVKESRAVREVEDRWSLQIQRKKRDKILLWDYLTHVTQQWNGDVIIMGDFNEVRLKSDRFGSVFNAHGANLFNTFITNAGLKEVPLGAITLERYLSDHRTILLREAHLDYGPTPFRFFHHWMEIDGFDKFVEATWKDAPIHASDAMRGLTFKLKHLKSKLKEWTRGKMNEMNSGKDKFKLELRKLDSDIDSGICSDDVIKKRSEVVQKLLDIDKIQAMEVAQKTKIKWCIEGDENSNFFHGMLNKKRSQLSIRGIMINGVWIEDPLAVKREFYQHFSNRFAKPDSHRALLDMEFPNKISLEKQSELEHEVSREELKQAVWDCGTDKSPGPDGFTFGFFRKFWHLIEEDIFEAVHYFFCHGNIPSGCNSSFITLIPKIPDANLVKDFRPISLIGGIYKIIAKILSNRLVGVLSDIVNEVQSAFIADRQILDGPFILNEVIQWCKLKKKQSFIFKVDFEKAFDSVRWDFLDDVLKNFSFGNKWCRWIQSCLKSSRVMESLHISFKRVVDAGMFKGIKLDPSTTISHMFYADDVVFMGQWCDDNINILTHLPNSAAAAH